MDEFHLGAYKRDDLYKERMNNYHDRRIEKRDFKVGDWVYLFNSRLKLFLGKLKSRWSMPFKVCDVFPSGVVELEGKDESLFNVNGKRVTIYVGPMDDAKLLSTVYLDEV
ncbi:uncharacterized protein LOC107868914 [Capsicum annuum]|uniref:uncharacterized protein LOC107868914 n=1 Tax=Capsicum annuum TaxID=4072 RepID=UPI0007BFE967|nr:uncharacterized protein LOC107868914 [Capsicum annuum]